MPGSIFIMKLQNTHFYMLFVAVLGLVLACNRQPGQPVSSQQTTALSSEEEALYLQRGQEIAGATFAALSSRLQQAMQQGGVAYAAPYCNLVALPIADSLSRLHDAVIRRTSLLVRNPEDAPLAHEWPVLRAYEQQWQQKETLKPTVALLGDGQRVAFYAPISVNAFCLSCHGKLGETLSAKDYEAIQAIYPEDQAIGYSDGDWRGIWSIAFKRQ